MNAVKGTLLISADFLHYSYKAFRQFGESHLLTEVTNNMKHYLYADRIPYDKSACTWLIHNKSTSNFSNKSEFKVSGSFGWISVLSFLMFTWRTRWSFHQTAAAWNGVCFFSLLVLESQMSKAVNAMSFKRESCWCSTKWDLSYWSLITR